MSFINATINNQPFGLEFACANAGQSFGSFNNQSIESSCAFAYWPEIRFDAPEDFVIG